MVLSSRFLKTFLNRTSKLSTISLYGFSNINFSFAANVAANFCCRNLQLIQNHATKLLCSVIWIEQQIAQKLFKLNILASYHELAFQTLIFHWQPFRLQTLVRCRNLQLFQNHARDHFQAFVLQHVRLLRCLIGFWADTIFLDTADRLLI